MKRIAGSCLLFFSVGVMACGAEAPLPVDQQAPQEAVAADDDSAPMQPSGVLPEAPGYVPFAYPEPPYGVATGATMENMEFLGWHNPIGAGFALDTTVPVRIADFYDPNGEKGIELLMINAVAVWCGVCRTEYADLRTEGIHAKYGPRGLALLGILFEDNDGGPADYADLVNWSNSYQVDFPFVLDPGFKSGVYFDRSATPMNMLIDARTMEILTVVTGYNPQIYETIDSILTQRGR